MTQTKQSNKIFSNILIGIGFGLVILAYLAIVNDAAMNAFWGDLR